MLSRKRKVIAPAVPTGTKMGMRFSAPSTSSLKISSASEKVPLLFQSAQTWRCAPGPLLVTLTFASPTCPATSGVENTTPSSSSISEASSPVALASGCPSASTSIVVPSINGAVWEAAS